MKTKISRLMFSLFAILTLASVLFVSPLNAQVKIKVDKFDNNSSMQVTYNTGVSSTDTVSSYAFQLPKYDGADSIRCFYGKLSTSASGKPHITTTIKGSYDLEHYTSIATFGAAGDSLETYQVGHISMSSQVYPYYIIQSIGTAGNKTDSRVRLDLYFTKPEN